MHFNCKMQFTRRICDIYIVCQCNLMNIPVDVYVRNQLNANEELGLT